MSETNVVIDMDMIIYRAAAAGEKRSILATHNDSGRTKSFDTRTALKDFIKDTKWVYEDFTIEDVQTPDPIENVLHTIKAMVGSIQEATFATNTYMVIDGKGNFRDDLPLPTKYKGNRVDTIRPVHLGECKKFVMNKWQPNQAFNREADDLLSEMCYKGMRKGEKWVAATADKDQRGFPCYYYDFTKPEQPIYLIDGGIGKLYLNDKKAAKGHGFLWLCYQWCCGDSSDCYKPSQLSGAKFGDAGAVKLLGHLQTKQEVVDAVVSLYKKWYPEPFEYVCWKGETHQADWKSVLELYLKCAHMLTYSDNITLMNFCAHYDVEINQ